MFCLRTLTNVLWIALLLTALVSCESTKRYFTVSSHPEGAVIFVDSEPRGQTNFECLVIDFKKRRHALVRVEKEGYQADGMVLSAESPRYIAFFLQESPSNKSILQVLNQLHQVLDRLSNKVEALETGDHVEAE